ncbi:MAG: C-terminal helicase domain-containing protein, partial [Parvularcula sp.]|nr:C-terminal helicase domain-containing protein [Parvularcula sp.]
LANDQVETAIIFANRKTTVRDLNKHLQKRGFASGEIHGDMDQASRLKELDRFKSGDVNILVASDVAARGLDIKGVSHVFNFDTPWHPDDYVHRIGRTGRAGAKGRAFTFVAEDDDEAISNVEKLTGNKIKVFGKDDVRVELAEGAAKADQADDEPSDDKPAEKKRRTRVSKGRDEQKPAPKERRSRSRKAEEKPQRSNRSARSNEADDSVPAGEWNGPKPGFLDVGLD